MIRKIFIITLLLVVGIFAFATAKSYAAEVNFFDSTDRYLGACQLTDKSEWSLSEDADVTKFEIWYSWNQGETTLPVRVFFNGEKFAEFEAIRSACDPYQQQWCNADYQINKKFPKGKYTTEIPNARQCLKPGGTGAVRLYKDDVPVKNEEPVPAPPKVEEQPVAAPAVGAPAATVPTSSAAVCSCKQTTVILVSAVSGAATSLVVALAISLLLKKR